MTIEELYKELTYVDATREKRLKYANMVLDDLSLMPYLMTVLFMTDDKISFRAAWILEYVCAEYIGLIIPYLDDFTLKLKEIHLDSAVRPVAKVCELLAKSYVSKQTNLIKKTISAVHKERIVEACFDWMIQDEKIATKAYAMNTLFLFGKDYKWVHPELSQILEQDFQNQSAGYKARAKHILKKIKTKNNQL
ncbi:adenylosuccinate lyase [Yeosuana sp. AK3]